MWHCNPSKSTTKVVNLLLGVPKIEIYGDIDNYIDSRYSKNKKKQFLFIPRDLKLNRPQLLVSLKIFVFVRSFFFVINLSLTSVSRSEVRCISKSVCNLFRCLIYDRIFKYFVISRIWLLNLKKNDSKFNEKCDEFWWIYCT